MFARRYSSAGAAQERFFRHGADEHALTQPGGGVDPQTGAALGVRPRSGYGG